MNLSGEDFPTFVQGFIKDHIVLGSSDISPLIFLQQLPPGLIIVDKLLEMAVASSGNRDRSSLGY